MKRSVKILVSLSTIALGLVIFLEATRSLESPENDSQHSLKMNPLLSNPFIQKEPISPIPDTLNLNTQKIHLGEKLFHDKNLSHNNTLSCASCHDLQKGGADGLALSNAASFQKTKLADQPVFNSPTVFNATFNFVQGWQGTAKTLEQQTAIPLFNTFEMGNTNWDNILKYLNQKPEYKQLFQQVYRRPILGEHVIDAISEFERSLITPNAPFDQYLKGNLNILSDDELKGYQLFKTLGCISCHHGINVGGNMFQKAGIFKPMFEKQIPASLSDSLVIQHSADNKEPLFKVPSLRNIALTAPYFHDGSVDTLEEAIDIMAKHQLGITLPLDENHKIQAFLNALTGQYKGQSLSHE